jgi:hypothetical protein
MTTAPATAEWIDIFHQWLTGPRPPALTTPAATRASTGRARRAGQQGEAAGRRGEPDGQQDAPLFPARRDGR